MINNKIAALTGFTLILSSCGSNYKRPESFSAKMARFESKKKPHNIVPKVEVSDFNKTKQVSRGPASIQTNKETKKYSNKRLYFLSLYDQYTKMSKYNPHEAPELTVCPSFHTSLIDYKDKGRSTANKTRINYSKIELENYKHHPELFLPITGHSQKPRVIDMVKGQDKKKIKELVEKAIALHTSKTYSELQELCQTGSSDNYYIYENLITTNIQTKLLTPRKESLETLLKTTLFSNMAILSSLKKKEVKTKSRGIASTTSSSEITNELFDRINVNWSKSYFSK